MMSSGMLRRVALVRTNVPEEPGASFIRVTRIGELGTSQAACVVPSSPIRERLKNKVLRTISKFTRNITIRGKLNAFQIPYVYEEWCLMGCYAVWLL
jgi:hypothetical protein